jgi:hypothetical protein
VWGQTDLGKEARVGFIAKSQTKKRVAVVSGPVNEALAGTPWLTTAAIPTGALIRSSVFALDLTGVRSNTARGSTSIFTPTYTAQLWVETNDFKKWVFVLGVGNGAGGIAADWVVELAIGDDRSVSIGTSRWLTKDGALVHGDHHDALRTELLRAVGVGQLTEENGEAEVTASSLKIAQQFETPARGPEQSTFSYSTTLDLAAISERLQQAGLPVTSSSPESITWALGLPKHNSFDYATATLSGGSVSVDANVGSQSETARRMAHSDLRYLIERIRLCLRSKDPTAEFHGPEELAP